MTSAVAVARATAQPIDKKETTSGRLMKLEALRGFAALYVLAHHVFLSLGPRTGIWHALLFRGIVAVIVFFVLSGFVIEHATGRTRNLTFRKYFLKRFARIFPIFTFALILAYAVSSLVAHALIPLDFRALAGNVVMLQGYDLVSSGRWVDAFCGNSPLWSLTYEWWFYMMYYPLRKYVPMDHQRWVVAGISILGVLTNMRWPNQVSMVASSFVIWWLGVEMARSFAKDRVIALRRISVPSAMIVLLFFVTFFAQRLPGISYEPGLQMFQRQQFESAIMVLAGGLIWQQLKFAGFSILMKPFGIFASISYALYIFHYPLVILLPKAFPHINPFGMVGVFVLLTILLAWLAEGVLQPRISRLITGGANRRLGLPRTPEIRNAAG